MKNLLVFLFGATCGAVGMMFYTRKSIKKRLEIIEQNAKEASEKEKKEEVPFEMKEEKKKEQVPEALSEATAVNYNKIINENDYRGHAPVPVGSTVMSAETVNEADYGVSEIDMETFMYDKSNAKERLVYYQGDKVLCTENGTIYPNPAEMIGVMWQQCIGKYADNTAFIRNKRLVTDFEIYVEDGLYTDEYGDENNFRED